MPSIQRRYSLAQRAGWNVTVPSSTTAVAFAASGPILTYHCGESSGAMTAFERDDTGTVCGWSSTPVSAPLASRSATMVWRASKRSWPAYGPPCSLSVPSRCISEIVSRPWRCPMA